MTVDKNSDPCQHRSRPGWPRILRRNPPSRSASRGFSMLELKVIAAAVALLVILGAGWKIRHDGKAAERARQVQAQAKELTRAVEISRQTAETRAAEQTETAQEGRRYETIIWDRIARAPAPAGVPDPDIMRAVSAAHAGAVCAARRVQREECSPDPTAAPEDD